MLTGRLALKNSLQDGELLHVIEKDLELEFAQGAPVEVVNPSASAPLLLVCEHASNHIPTEFADLGLDPATRQSHVAWDPGAMAVATHLGALLDARLVAGTVSRLVYDCNRPPEAPDAMPAHSELFDIPGNANLGNAERAHRSQTIYAPFRAALAASLTQAPQPRALVTVHSFTPVYMGKSRAVELGILHDEDSRLADEMLRLAPQFMKMDVQRNAPYGPENGVTHTLRLHGIGNGILNVMLEIRNDLIVTGDQQRNVAGRIARLLSESLTNLGVIAQREAPSP
jgi:predicted N-formylglutamate amidohydrolase